MRKTIAIISCLFLLFSGCGEKNNEHQQPGNSSVPATDEVKVTVLDIGKADCIVIQTKMHTIMIDTGEKNNADEIEEYLNQEGITHIDYLELTHYDKDHIGGLPKLLKAGVSFDTIYAYNKPVESKAYRKMTEALEEYQKELVFVEKEQMLQVDDIVLEIYPTEKEEYRNDGEEDENEYSIVTKMTHGKDSFLFAADACGERLQELPEQMDVDVDYLKVPHHGRKDDYSEEFISLTSPKYAVITCSEKNPASNKLVREIQKANAMDFETKDGTVAAVSTGDRITVDWQ